MSEYYWVRVRKDRWYQMGGFANPRCFRKQQKNRGWAYYYIVY